MPALGQTCHHGTCGCMDVRSRLLTCMLASHVSRMHARAIRRAYRSQRCPQRVHTQHSIGTACECIPNPLSSLHRLTAELLLRRCLPSLLPCSAFTLSKIFCPRLPGATEMADDWHLRANTLGTSST